jgi:hypothetical protein
MYPFVKLALLGPMEKCSIHSPSFSACPQQKCVYQQVVSQTAAFLKGKKKKTQNADSGPN